MALLLTLKIKIELIGGKKYSSNAGTQTDSDGGVGDAGAEHSPVSICGPLSSTAAYMQVAAIDTLDVWTSIF